MLVLVAVFLVLIIGLFGGVIMQFGLLDITIEYCATWKYTPRAVSLAEEVLGDREIEAYIRSLQLIPASGGKFEVTVNDELLYSKLETGRHAEPGEAKATIVKALEEIQKA